MAALLVACFILCAVLVRLALKNAYIFACATVGFNFLQAIAVLPSFNVNWPPFVLQFYDIVTILNLDLQIFRPECMVKNGSGAYFYVFGLKLLAPAIFAGIVVIYYAGIYLYYLWRKGRDFGKGSLAFRVFPLFTDKEMLRYRHACMNAYLSILIFMYLMLASTALEIYGCTQQLDGRYTMNREPIVDCYEPQWYKLVAVSAVAIAVYIVGLPTVVAVVLIRRRRNLHKEKNLVRLGMLYLRYRPQQYFWELCVLLRKFGILGGKILFASTPMGQVVVAFLSVLIATVAQFVVRPFRAARVNRLESLHLVCSSFVLVLGIIFLGLKGTISAAAQNFLGALIVIIIMLNILAIVVAILFELRYNRMLAKHGISGRFASDRIEVPQQFFDWGIRLVRHSQAQFTAAAVGTARRASLSSASGKVMDEKSTIITLELTSSRALDLRVQMFSAELVPRPVAPPGSSCWTRFTTYMRSLNIKTEPGDIIDQVCESTADCQTHLITMTARRVGRYSASVYALPNDGLYRARAAPSKWRVCFMRMFDANYERKREQSADIDKFASQGAEMVMHIGLTVSNEWSGTDGLSDIPGDASGQPSFVNLVSSQRTNAVFATSDLQAFGGGSARSVVMVDTQLDSISTVNSTFQEQI